MSNYKHQTAPTQFVEAAGIRFAYRRFANRRFGAKIDIPLLFFMHFTGTMDHWDPALTDGFAQDREVILFNNAGVSSSGGEVPTSIEEMAQRAAAFFGARYNPADELWLRVFFTPSERSQAAVRKDLERQRARKENRDPLPNEKIAPAQVAALQKWGAPAKDPYER